MLSNNQKTLLKAYYDLAAIANDLGELWTGGTRSHIENTLYTMEITMVANYGFKEGFQNDATLSWTDYDYDY